MNKTSAAIVRTLLLGTSCLSVFGLVAAKAQPTGGNVVLGTASITDRGGNLTTIDQKTGKAIINWQSFSVAAGGTVKFNQPGSSSITLNRVLGPETSSIYGNLLANGQVWLINRNGVLFGAGSKINVGGLIATTADIANGDFASGNYAFGGGTGAAVVNQGTIRTSKGGSVVLSGASVSNQGLIEAETGTVVLGGASAFTVDFVGDGLIKYAITAPAGKADNGQSGVSNSGTVAAQGGHVIMTARAAADVTDAVVNNTGMISATSAKVQNGEVVLDAGDGDVNVGGTIDASGRGSGETGGSVAVTGRNITVADNTNIDVSGDAGGGNVRIGGDAHGAGPLPNAANTHVGTATIRADAISSGNGGKLVVWSNGLTDFSGIFSAKGGAAGGDGGFIETSGHTLNIGPQAKVDTTAANGQTGTWLLDPKNIVISAGEGNDTQLSGGLLALGTDPGDTDQVRPATIISALATTNVTLQASNNITVQDPVIYASSYDLSLMAMNRILVGASIQNTQASGGGAVNLVAGWDGTTPIGSILSTPGSYGFFDHCHNILGDVEIGSENGPVAVGSASGTTMVASAFLGLTASNAGYAQLGYHATGGGNIVVRTTGDIELDASEDEFAMIGNGSLDDDVSGPITGDIDVRMGGSLSLYYGEGVATAVPWIGNAAGGGGSETGNLILVAGSTQGGGNVDFTINLAADLQGGDVLLGLTDTQDTAYFTDFVYNSPHTLSLVATGDIDINGVIQNSGTGAINVIAGWDGTTVDPAHLADPGVYGNGDGETGAVFIDATSDCPFETLNASVGSKGGTVTVAGAYVDLEAWNGYAQIGYTGSGGGDIKVLSTSDVVLDGNFADDTAYAMIGNGAPFGNIDGPVTGNIFVSAAGNLILASDAGDGCPWDVSPAAVLIGNYPGSGDSLPAYSGNVTIFAAGIDDEDELGGEFSDNVLHDILGGDVTVGITDPESGLAIGSELFYDSPYTLSLLSAGDLTLGASLQNSGSGGVTLVAGWNGDTDLGHVSAPGFYGNNDGTVFVGGFTAHGPLAVGAAMGPLDVYGANLVVDGRNGYAQLGYHGGGGGNIFVNMTGSISVVAGTSDDDGDFSAQIGNGSLLDDIEGDVTGNISMTAGGSTTFVNEPNGVAWLGNAASDGYKETGDVTALTRSGFFYADFIDADLGTSADTGGNVFIGFYDPAISPLSAGGFVYNSPHDFTFAGAGSLNVIGNITNGGTGALTLVTGWDGQTVGSAAEIEAAHGFGLNGATMTIGGSSQYEDVSVGTAGGSTNLLTGDLVVAPQAGYYAQVGYHGPAGGDIHIVTTGDLTMTAGAVAHDYAMIGNGSLNGDVSGDITGNIDITVGGTTSLNSDPGNTFAWIGNVAASGFSETGTVRLVTFDFASGDALGTMLAADTAGGDVTVGVTDAASVNAIDDPVVYSGSHALNILTAGTLIIDGSIQNSGTGALNIVAGWDGTTFDPAHFADSGVFGNNDGSILIGGPTAAGDVAVGGRGATSLLAGSIVIDGENGYAQAGFHGTGGGPLVIGATGLLVLSGASSADYAQAGNGTSFGSNADGGSVVLKANSILVASNAAAVASTLTIALTGGSAGSSPFPLRIAADTLNLTTTGGSAFLASPSNGVALGTVSTNGGALTLSAGGAITQSAALHTGALSVSTTSGAITLTNGGNSFGPLTVSTQGSDAASLTSGGAVVVAGANVGGTFTLASGGAIGQTGAIVAGNGLVVSANGGIALGSGGNSFASLVVTTSGLNDALVTDATAVTLGASTVGGTLTLNAGGTIGQSGPLTTHGLDLSTSSGSILLTDAANSIGGLARFSAPGAVTFYNSLGADIGASTAGGDFIVLSKGNVNFLGSVQLGTGNVFAVAGWDGTTTNPAQFGNAGVYGNNSGAITVGGTGATGDVAVGSNSGATSFYAASLNVAGMTGYAQLGYHGSGGGAILVRTLGDMTLTGSTGYAMVGNGSFNADVTGNETGDIDVRAGGNLNLSNAGAAVWIGDVAHSGSETGNMVLVMNDENDNGQNNAITQFIVADIAGGDFTIGFTGSEDQGPDHNIAYNSSHALNILIAGNAVFGGSLQNAGSGAINIVGGWDGHSLSGFGNAGVAGNGGHGVIIGGSDAAGGVAVGSAGGQTSVYGASLALDAVNGYAQLGFNGHGSGAILVNVAGGVTLNGGAAAGEFALIGNGGLDTSGNNSGDITITAGGDVALNGGTGSEAYAQVGEGGAESNTGSAGYSNSAAVTVTAANVLLNAGSGAAAYSMIGNGGYKAGLNLAGAAINSGNITITAGHSVSLNGNGADAFAEIGNGGSQSNLNPTASATGTDSGDIVVHAPNGGAGSVTLTAGAGANAYALIGNGGYAANSGGAAIPANFTISGNVSVTDLALTGGNSGANSFALIGNGDASRNSVANVGGDITIDANGQITYTNGLAPHSPATIGNFTGEGSVTGTLTGAQPPSDVSTNPAALGVIASNTANNKSNTNDISLINTVVVIPPDNAPEGATQIPGETTAQGPIATLEGGDETSSNPSDTATVVIADSLDGSKKPAGSQTIIAGILKQTTPFAGQSAHGVPPADQDFSSWGNEALWQ